MIQFRVDYEVANVTIKSFDEFIDEFFDIHNSDYPRSEKFEEYLKSQYDAALINIKNNQDVIRLNNDHIEIEELDNYRDEQLITFAFPDVVNGTFYDKCDRLSAETWELRELIEERDRINKRIERLTKNN